MLKRRAYDACKIFDLTLAMLLHYVRKTLTTKMNDSVVFLWNSWVALKTG